MLETLKKGMDCWTLGVPLSVASSLLSVGWLFIGASVLIFTPGGSRNESRKLVRGSWWINSDDLGGLGVQFATPRMSIQCGAKEEVDLCSEI
jgi:hypothetical protein